MPIRLPPNFAISSEIRRAIDLDLPVVALESTVITHGLPSPQNLTLALDMEQEVRSQGATPATIAVLDGMVRIGLSMPELERLANAARESIESRKTNLQRLLNNSGEADLSLQGKQVRKVSGTTVAGTLFAADKVGLKVFATGGIGGVHEVEALDISTDLPALAETPLFVVCAGAKAILDLPATLEALETLGVPVVGFQTDEFPAFYSRSSGLPVSIHLDTPQNLVDFGRAHWGIGMQSAILVCQPPPVTAALDRKEVDGWIKHARHEAHEKHIKGQEVTPFLLQRLGELSNGATLRANLALLLNNARLAAQIARAWNPGGRQQAA
jgi:pseudouridine-5'-phosphate glycosidase